MIWVELTVADVVAHLPTDVAPIYNTWIATNPDKAVRLGEITDNTLQEFRDAIKSNPKNVADSRDTYLPQSAIRHAESIIIFSMAMEIGISLSTSANMAATAANVYLRQLPYGRYTFQPEGHEYQPSPHYTVPFETVGRTLAGLMFLFIAVAPARAGWISPGQMLYDTSVFSTYAPQSYTNTTITVFGHLTGIDRSLSAFTGLLSTKADKSIYGPYGYNIYRNDESGTFSALIADWDNIDGTTFLPRIFVIKGDELSGMTPKRITTPAVTTFSIKLGNVLLTATNGSLFADGILVSGGTSAPPSTAVNSYPVFRLEVGTIEGNWTDFALKASTNNWSNSTSVYYYLSYSASQPPENPDTNAYVYYTDDYAPNPRVWLTKGATNAIGEQLFSTNTQIGTVYFMPSHDCEWASWMTPTNKQLVWSWARADALGYAMNANGTEIRWQPIRPESWEVERTTP